MKLCSKAYLFIIEILDEPEIPDIGPTVENLFRKSSTQDYYFVEKYIDLSELLNP